MKRIVGICMAAGLAAVALGSVAAPKRAAEARPDNIPLGRSAAGEPCTATRDWNDAAARGPFDQSWSLTCRNVAASRPLGFVRVYAVGRSHQPPLPGPCAPASDVVVGGIGPMTVRRCRDRQLAAEAVVASRWARGSWVVMSAVPAILGPAEAALRIVEGGGRPPVGEEHATAATINAAALPAWPAGQSPAEQTGNRFDPAVPLSQGISLNHKGLYLEASRVLNDALSRLGPDGAPDMRVELLLEAALADSNIGFSSSAAEHFAEADPILSQLEGQRALFLESKRQAYGALNLLNQRRFREALASLDKLATPATAPDQPLNDPAIIRSLNETGTGGRNAGRAVALPETASLAQLTLDAQINWARSAALLALGEEQAARIALDRAQAAYAPLLRERIDPTLILWLGAQLERQRGRLEARAGRYEQAIALYDTALDGLRRASLATGGTGREPSVAEAQLERAVIVNASGAREAAQRDFAAAVDALAAANELGGTAPPVGLDRYLDLLVAEATKGERPDTAERYFRAMQAIGEPAVARQLRQLQAVVASDPGVGTKLRDRAELERDITRLRYAIADADTTPGTDVEALDKDRRAAEAKLLEIDAALATNRRFSTIDDRPTTLVELRAALRPGEAYLKLVQAGGQTFGLFATADKTSIYRVAAPNTELDKLATAIRASVDGQLNAGRLVPFDVPAAYTLFRLLTGDVTDAVMAARSLVIDPAGPLRSLPAGVLVTDRDSVTRQAETAATRPFDFTGVSFLAAHTVLSTAVSPRSFLVTRALKPSSGARPMLGLGDHVPPPLNEPAHLVRVGFSCSVPYATLAGLSRQLVPISSRELEIAGRALGYPDAPEVTGTGFSDTAILARGDLADYQVLHFATHGLKEGEWGCAKSPPALLTSFGDARSDGLLSFSEIAGLRLDANLVVLSACDTASGVTDERTARTSGQEEAGSILEGLVRAFLTANSRAVLATYWPVSAEGETDRFIAALYGTARSRPIGDALQAAQRSLISDPRYSHPFFWGAYFLVGDATKPMLSGAAVPAPTVAAR